MSRHASHSQVRDTLNGLLAFVVPGPDTYSVAQGVSTPEPGGVDAGVLDALIDTLNASAPYQPGFSAIVATVLNDFANAANPAAGGFANLLFAEKAAVFQLMDAGEAVRPLAAVLPAFVAYLAYSEAGVFDPVTRRLTGIPVGWTISNYSGASNGRDELRGYYRGLRG